MKIGKLNEICPKCGCQDKTIRRLIEDPHKAHARTREIACSECGYVFRSGED